MQPIRWPQGRRPNKFRNQTRRRPQAGRPAHARVDSGLRDTTVTDPHDPSTSVRTRRNSPAAPDPSAPKGEPDRQFYLTVLGGLTLRGQGASLESSIGKRRLVLLATLAAAGERGVSRDFLGALFWPESDDARARGALKQAVYALRTELGPDSIPA